MQLLQSQESLKKVLCLVHCLRGTGDTMTVSSLPAFFILTPKLILTIPDPPMTHSIKEMFPKQLVHICSNWTINGWEELNNLSG